MTGRLAKYIGMRVGGGIVVGAHRQGTTVVFRVLHDGEVTEHTIETGDKP